MDVTFSNVLEGTRQYFLGLPKQAQAEGSGQSVWPAGGPPPEEGAPAQSGAPTPSSRPPSAAAAPPLAAPPRPPSEPLEPEPHIIHKATVMREAAEKRREQPELDDEDEPAGGLSPPSHFIRKPQPRTLPSPAPAPAAPCPSPARPPSAAPLPPPAMEPQLDSAQYRPPVHRATPTARPPDHFAPGRPPDPYSASRPPEPYARYHYESSLTDAGRSSHGPPAASPQPSSMAPRSSPQTYARLSSSMPQHAASRLREVAAHSPPMQRYALPPTQPPPPLNDRVPPIHHPPAPSQRVNPVDSRVAQYQPVPQRREPSPYARHASHYDRHPALPQRKYDPQQAYPGYRPAPTAPLPVPSHRVETHHQVPYKHGTVDPVSAHYPTRPLDRATAPASQPYQHDVTRHSHDPSRHLHESSRRADYPNMSRSVDSRSSYHYPIPSTSSAKYVPAASAAVPVVQNSTLPSRPLHRPATAPKSNYEYPTPQHVQTSPARSTVKPGYPSQQARMTVSVTTLVNQMNQTKQKRESPLDLSVKTVKNSADSSTTQDDVVDSATLESKTLPLAQRPISNNRQAPAPTGYVDSLKVDFAPDFTQYRERNTSHSYSTPVQPGHAHPVRYNGGYETPRPLAESFPVESRHQVYSERSKYSVPAGRTEYVPRIDLTRSIGDDRRPENRIRDDRHLIIEERKRPAGPISSNIPEKIVRYETWSADSRIDRMSQSAREQHELMSRPVYSYSSHKQFEAYQNEQKRVASSVVYREHHSHSNHRYTHSAEPPTRERTDYHAHNHDRNSSNNNRHVIQKIPSHRDIIHPHHLDPHSGVPADKRVLSILRNSLETKQTGIVEPAKSARQIPDLIVIDDVDDSVIEITDLTKDNDLELAAKTLQKCQNLPSLAHHIKMPKAVDSIPREAVYQKCKNADSKRKSPENDVASRIRTKAELKVLPPSQDNSSRSELKQDVYRENDNAKLLPKSQKQHLFNQIREDLRLESVIKCEKSETIISEVKSEPMNIDEIEKDAAVPIKTENILENLEPGLASNIAEEDLDWANACDSFMEQLKTGCIKRKSHRKSRIDTLDHDNERKEVKIPKVEPVESIQENVLNVPPILEPRATLESSTVVVKQEPMEEDEMKDQIEPTLHIVHELSDNIIDEFDTKKSLIIEVSTESDKSERNELFVDKHLDEEKDSSKISTLTSAQNTTDGQKEKVKNISSVQELSDKLPKIKQYDDNIEKSQTFQEQKEISKIEKSSPVEYKKELVKLRKVTAPKTIQKVKSKIVSRTENIKSVKKHVKASNRTAKAHNKMKIKSNKHDHSSTFSTTSIKKEVKEQEPTKTVIKEELESTDDDEPLIKSKIMKEKEIKYQLLKDLSEKSAYVKLECFDVDMNKNTRISMDSITKDNEKPNKGKHAKQVSKAKGKPLLIEKIKSETHNEDTSSDSDGDDLSVARRLRLRKAVKNDDNKTVTINKSSVKTSPSKKLDNSSASNSSTPIRKPGFGDGSDFHQGWEEELYRYKCSLRMPARLIAIPRGCSGGKGGVKGSGGLFGRVSTSLPDLDPAPLSPAPSSAPSAATDDLYARRPDKLTLDSDLESNSSCSAANRLHYDSEASTSTVFSSSKAKKERNSIVDVLIQKCGKRHNSKKKSKDTEDKTPKIIPKSSNSTELLPTPSLGLLKNGNKGGLSAKKEKLMEDIFYLGAFRKETVTAFRNAFIKNTDGLIGATEEFAPVVLKSRTRTESRVLKQRATIKEVFGDERPASAPPTSCRDEEPQEIEEKVVEIVKEPESKPKLKSKKILKDKLIRRSNSIRDGLRSTKSLKRNDAKGRMLRLKKRNSLMKSLANKRLKDMSGNKIKKEKVDDMTDDKDQSKEVGSSIGTIEGHTKRRLKRLFGRRKFSSGFDYIRKKKKIIPRKDTPNNKVRRPAVKPSPESVHDIQKEIKGWFINKSVGETHLHRAARLGYTDCVAYCLEKMSADPSARDNAGFTPLHVAAAKGHVRIARLLLQYGANVSAAAQGGIRPLHEACENCHVEIIRLLLAYGADPLLGTYTGQTPEELTEGQAARLLRLHIADVQGHAIEPWRFPPPADIIDRDDLGCDSLSSPPPASPPPPPDSIMEIQCTDAPLPPFYSLRTATGQPADGLWCLLQDITNLLQIKSKESLLKQIHCGSGSPKELLREIRTQEFLERAQCHQLLGAGEKVNVRASKVALVRVTDKLRQLLKIETVLIN